MTDEKRKFIEDVMIWVAAKGGFACGGDDNGGLCTYDGLCHECMTDRFIRFLEAQNHED